MKHSKKPAAFELAQTAVALSQLHGKDVKLYPPEHYFDEADSLLAKAQTYVEEGPARQKALNSLGSDLLQTADGYRRADRPIPFECLLRPRYSLPKGKKVRTQVGAITTVGGLKKAIRRYFFPGDASRIIKAESMTGKEWDHLIAAQNEAIKKRAAKRVKGGNRENSQPT